MFKTANYSFFSSENEETDNSGFNSEDIKEILNEQAKFESENWETSGTSDHHHDDLPTIEDKIISQLRERLIVKKKSVNIEKLERFWRGISFKFSMNAGEFEVDPFTFRLKFNSVEFANLSAVDEGDNTRDSNWTQETQARDSEYRELEESPKVQEQDVEKTPRDEYQQDIQVIKDDQELKVSMRSLILEEICNEFIEKEVKIQETVRAEQADKAVDEDQSAALEDSREISTTKKLSIKEETIKKEKITMSMLKNLFQSLSDELTDNDIASVPVANHTLLSMSSKKIRPKTAENPSVYNKILNGIMKVEPPQVKKSLKRLSPTKSRRETWEGSNEPSKANEDLFQRSSPAVTIYEPFAITQHKHSKTGPNQSLRLP
jgi:hypothetical protein